MATDRRSLLKGLAALLLPLPAFGVPAEPRFIASRRTADGHCAAVFDIHGDILASHDLPGRGHGAAASPNGQAVLFARRPGRLALAVSAADGGEIARIRPPADRHFYGHGFFSADGRRLYATENDFGAARGVLGIYDAANDFTRIGEIDTGGTGPHETLLLPGGAHAVIANGGIETHPDWPRRKLNLPSMQPSLTMIELATGWVIQRAEPPPELRSLSIRHITLAGNDVWFACQDERPESGPRPLAGVYRPGEAIKWIMDSADPDLRGYLGSIAASRDGTQIAATSPRGGRAVIWSTASGRRVETLAIADVCGAVPVRDGFLFSDGQGRIWRDGCLAAQLPCAWDNHIYPIRA